MVGRSRYLVTYRVIGLVALVAASGLMLAACGARDTASSDSHGDVTVFAAASLTAAFTALGDAFMAANPDMDIRFNFAASSALVTQIDEGAPADVFAAADLNTMARVVDAANNASEPIVFTTNLAEIIVGPGNPMGITGVADLARQDLMVISCAPEVPCGRYAQQILDNAGVTVTFRSWEENVRGVVSKVALGEADAGIVYATDVTDAADAASGVPIPAEINIVAEYPIVVTKMAPNPAGAQAFIDFVVSDDGQAILADHGFVSP